MKNTTSLLLILFGCILFALPLQGQDTTMVRAFSLKEAQDFALENNLNIKNAQLNVEQAQKVIWENTALGLPQVTSSFNYNNNLNLMTTLLPGEIIGQPGEKVEVQFGTQHNAIGTIAANQLIFSGPYIVGLQAAKIYRESQEQSLQKTEIDTKELIAQNYYLALLAEETYIIIDSNVLNLQKTLFETQKMYEMGFVEETDVDQIRVSLISLENSKRTALSQIEVSYKLLKYQMGIDLNIEIQLKEKLEDIIVEINLAQTLEDPFNVLNHIDFQLSETREYLAQLNMKRQKAEYLPSLSAVYNNNWSAMRDEFNFFNPNQKWYYSSVLGFTLDFPIFSSGGRQAKVSQLKIEYQKAGNTKKLVEDGLILENQQARSDFISAYQKYLSEKENVQISKKILDRTQIKVGEGITSSLEFTQINDQYLITESNYLTALLELLNAKIRLDKAMNRL
ncbi:MAG: TolC family protein [Bacteroidales bacterium]|nr:TolC family protein [Bacteroidales bacterium]